MNPRAIAVGWGLLVAVVLLGVPLSLRDRLPDPLAVHWSGSTPDGSSSFTAFMVTTAVSWLVPWAILVAAQGRMAQLRRSRAYWWGFLFGVPVFAAGLHLSVVYANLDRATWQQAELPAWIAVVLIAAALAVGIAAGYAGRGEPDRHTADDERVPRLRLRPGERAVWVSRVTNPWLLGLGVAAGVGLVAAAGLEYFGLLQHVPGRLAPALAIVLLLGVFTSSIRVKVNEQGLAIGFGFLGWPVRRIPLARIEHAWSEERHPSQVGGWGIRGLPGRTAIMLRGGECLLLRYRSGGQLLVSVDDAERGASLINALVEERV
ncbi:MAG: DUF1648 domain-containing protein [Nonomuraea sp.]|nr:DUF1648 domain-containing protein [Nonomuraea sp.]